MLSKTNSTAQLGFYSSFEEQLSHQHPLYILSNRINWQLFETAFAPLFHARMGRPAKPIRRMVALLILKHLRNISDESVVEQWSENCYYQYFSGEQYFAIGQPCDASELVHFRHRIGEAGMTLLLKESIRINGKDALEEGVSIDTTVQEKNITFPTDAKLHRKIIAKCQKISAREGLPVRQSYKRVLKQLAVDQRFRTHPKQKAKARRADRKVKTIAGRLVRELERNLSDQLRYQNSLDLFKKVLAQQRQDKQKIYSLHEPDVQCICKGKEHKKYEFGNKVSVVYTQNTGVIVGALSFRNEYDGNTLEKCLAQTAVLRGQAAVVAVGDRGYRGTKNVEATTIMTPKPFPSTMTAYKQKKLRKRFQRRAAIEPIIGHLKEDHRLKRNFYKGIFGDNINILLCAAAFNFKRMMNRWKSSFLCLFETMFFCFQNIIFRHKNFYPPKPAHSKILNISF